MNLLLDNLPEEVCGVPVNTDYRAMVKYELLMQDPEFSTEEKIRLGLQQFYRQPVPSLAKAWEGLLWYYRGGNDQPKTSAANRGSAHRAYDFEQDAAYIYAAFWQVYGIDLQAGPLHWWAFRQLLYNLPDTCLMGRIMGWRTADLSKLKGAEKKHIEEMRRRFALQGQHQQALTLAERDARFRARALQRYREVTQAAAEKQGR